jgi:lysophospholipase
MPKPWQKTLLKRWSKSPLKVTNVQSLLTPPNNWQWGVFHNANNQIIRYGLAIPEKTKALIVIAEGRTETAEEYFELIRDFNTKGYACAIMDWQGQGESYRHNDDNSRHHSVGFEQDISDFDEFLGHLHHIDLPKILLAHSMGGNITLRYLADHPDAFQCAYMIAPMLGLNPKRIIKYMAKAILNAASKFGWFNRHALGQSQWTPAFANIAKHKISSDPIRREKQIHLFKNNPALRCGGVTFGWLNEALKSIAILQKPQISNRIQTPVFIATAGKDVVVDNDGTLKVADLLPNCTVKNFKKSHHVIHQEADHIRDELLHSIEHFIS